MAVPIQNPKKAAILADLKRLLQCPGEGATLQRFLFGLSALDNHLPQDGLTVAALHEILPRSAGDGITAFGFALVLMARVAQAGPMLKHRLGLYANESPYRLAGSRPANGGVAARSASTRGRRDPVEA